MNVVEILDILPYEFENRARGDGIQTTSDVSAYLVLFPKFGGGYTAYYTSPEDFRNQGTYFKCSASSFSKTVTELVKYIMRDITQKEAYQKLYTRKFYIFKDCHGEELDPLELFSKLERFTL